MYDSKIQTVDRATEPSGTLYKQSKIQSVAKATEHSESLYEQSKIYSVARATEQSGILYEQSKIQSVARATEQSESLYERLNLPKRRYKRSRSGRFRPKTILSVFFFAFFSFVETRVSFFAIALERRFESHSRSRKPIDSDCASKTERATFSMCARVCVRVRLRVRVRVRARASADVFTHWSAFDDECSRARGRETTFCVFDRKMF